MKGKTYFNILAVLVTATILFASCTKENSDVRLDPKLTTTQVYGISSDTANVIGFVVASGSGFTERGICYGTATAPTIADSKVIYSGSAKTASFDVTLRDLHYATLYYARAYAISPTGTLYGEEITFTTAPVLPTVTTAAVIDITGTTATGGGNVSNNGGAEITARGVCYGPDANPTVDNSKTSDGTGDGEFVSPLKNLAGLTTYHVRAYAKNSVGVAYGEDVQFTTLVSVRTWFIPGDYVADSYPGTTFANWAPANSPMVKSLESSPDNLEGYVYMANASNQWKFATQPNWNGPNYGDDNNSGVLDPNAANNITSPAGYYKINANAASMTYTAIATNWGVIGDATPNGWNDETALTYDPATSTWAGGLHLTANSFKFRCNHNWNINYGSTAGNATLDAGGSNIPVSLEADYFFVLDLSHPNEYTYTANRWGLIGDATPDGWNSDQNMTWDAANHALTITLDLTAGAVKFRANDDWGLNLGGDLASLSQGGDNIPIDVAGNYTITLYLNGTGVGGHATIVKN